MAWFSNGPERMVHDGKMRRSATAFAGRQLFPSVSETNGGIDLGPRSRLLVYQILGLAMGLGYGW